LSLITERGTGRRRRRRRRRRELETTEKKKRRQRLSLFGQESQWLKHQRGLSNNMQARRIECETLIMTTSYCEEMKGEEDYGRGAISDSERKKERKQKTLIWEELKQWE
jgi:hypothetical protein